MSKDAIRMRAARKDESAEKTKLRQDTDAKSTMAARKSESAEKTQSRLAKAREYKQQRDQKESEEERLARVAKETAQRKARRQAAKKKANLAVLDHQNQPSTSKNASSENSSIVMENTDKNVSESQGLAEFRRIQTTPRSLSCKGGLPRHIDKTPSSGSDLNEDTISEYEKIRNQNILERNQKFKSLFGFTHPLSEKTVSKQQENETSKSTSLSDTADPDFVANVEPTTRRALPRRSCTQNLVFNFDNDSYAEKLENLVRNGYLFANTAHLEYLYGSELMEESSFSNPDAEPIEKKMKKKRKSNLDRKSKTAKKSQMYRENETQDQYNTRLKQSAKYNRDLSENVLYREKRKHVKRLKR